MNSLFQNAVLSIQLGINDYESEDENRLLSATRNLYSGVLLLAKYVLINKAQSIDPKIEAKDVIYMKYKPMIDKDQNLQFVPNDKKTIDFVTIGQRFKDFSIEIDQSHMKNLNNIRNELEHYFTKEKPEAVREVVSKALPIIIDLLNLIGEKPKDVFGNVWDKMLEVEEVYERELDDCQKTLSKVNWPFKKVGITSWSMICPQCYSDLVKQNNPENKEYESAECYCRFCGNIIPFEQILEYVLDSEFFSENYIAAKEGAQPPVDNCSGCGSSTYIITDDFVGCLTCGLELGSCIRCETELNPNNVSGDSDEFCDYCNHVMNKDD